ncbi:MAG: RNB domain-containing ribonuclease [Proteobacteria bacterium]|nr:RNB domain-containing ribonuclease [Pseudomonadota bacterium]
MSANQKKGTGNQRSFLKDIARQAMREHGLLPDFSPEVLKELSSIDGSLDITDKPERDLRQLLWCSIDNDDSLDLDQLTVAEKTPDGIIKIYVAVADVESLVKKGSAIDDHARQNTTSIYTDGEIFPMLPQQLSNDLTSLNYEKDRSVMIAEMTIDADGRVKSSDIYRALVCNHAKLAYNSVADWLEAKGPMPDAVAKVKGLDANIKLQDQVAQLLRKNRHEVGALDFETIHARSIFDEDMIKYLEEDRKNRAKELIEDFMIAANGATVQYLKAKGLLSFRRIVRSPQRWERIVEVVSSKYNYKLPSKPDAKSLALFLYKQKKSDPIGFPDLSLTIIKLIGKGEYVVEFPGEKAIGHFGLAVRDYTHSTAPNRRYPDLITQRILKAALKGTTAPYKPEELTALANLCTEKEDDATKVERRVAKSAAALLLSSRIGQTFDAICTGAADKGTWVRIFNPPVEGKLIRGFKGIDVGNKLRVKLIRTDAKNGYIDFEHIN